jgi:hypothetical protein
MTRPVGHISSQILALRQWLKKRNDLNTLPERQGRKLQTRTLEIAITMLEEYRDIIVRLKEQENGQPRA